MDVLLDGLTFPEGPRWHEGRLWFADWLDGQIAMVDLSGDRRHVMDVPSLPFCFDWLPDGRLLVVTNEPGRPLRRSDCRWHLDGLRRLAGVLDHPWNGILVDGRGNTYVNSIGFDMMAGEPPGPGIVAVVRPDGSVAQVAGDLQSPAAWPSPPTARRSSWPSPTPTTHRLRRRGRGNPDEPPGVGVHRRVPTDMLDAERHVVCGDDDLPAGSRGPDRPRPGGARPQHLRLHAMR